MTTALLKVHEAYTALTKCQLINENVITEDTIREFETILNSAQPSRDNAEDMAQYNLVKFMYNNNPAGFYNYLRNSGSRASCLILWTHTKSIINYFGLYGKFHLIWSPETLHYTYTEFVKQNKIQEEQSSQSTKPSTQRKNYRNFNKNWRTAGNRQTSESQDDRDTNSLQEERSREMPRRSKYNFNNRNLFCSNGTTQNETRERTIRQSEQTSNQSTRAFQQQTQNPSTTNLLTQANDTTREQFNGSWAELCTK
jgi:hypothetical protein